MTCQKVLGGKLKLVNKWKRVCQKVPYYVGSSIESAPFLGAKWNSLAYHHISLGHASISRNPVFSRCHPAAGNIYRQIHACTPVDGHGICGHDHQTILASPTSIHISVYTHLARDFFAPATTLLTLTFLILGLQIGEPSPSTQVYTAHTA